MLALLAQGHIAAQLWMLVKRLDLARYLAAGPRSVDDLAHETSTHGPTLKRMLATLAALGMVRHVDGDRYGATPLLAAVNPLPAAMNQAFYEAWGCAADTLYTGRPGWESAHGRPLYQSLDADPDLSHDFDAWTTATARSWLPAFHQWAQFERFGMVVDVGGGEGHLLHLMLAGNRDAHGVLLEREGVLGRAAIHLAPFESRWTALAADFRRYLPVGGDAYVFCRVLLNWDDETIVALLSRCARLLEGDARLLIWDAVMPEPDDPRYTMATVNDLNLLMCFGGGLRTRTYWKVLLERSGLHPLRLEILPGPVAFIAVEATASSVAH
jgi:hypothetical protein